MCLGGLQTPVEREEITISEVIIDSRVYPIPSTSSNPRREILPLSSAPEGQRMRLVRNDTNGLLRQRLIDLGFTPGIAIQLVRKGPKNNLIAVSVRDTVIALRSDEARRLGVTE